MGAIAWSLLTDASVSLHEYHEHVSGLLMPSQTSPSIHRTSAPVVNAMFLEGGRHAVNTSLLPIDQQTQSLPPKYVDDGKADAERHAAAIASAANGLGGTATDNSDMLIGTDPRSKSDSLHGSLDSFVQFPSLVSSSAGICPSVPLPPSPSPPPMQQQAISPSSISDDVRSPSSNSGSSGSGSGYAGIDYGSPAMLSPLAPRMRLGLSVNSHIERLLGFSREEIRQRLEISGWRGMLGMAEVDEAKQMLRHHFRGMFGMRSDFSLVAHLTTKVVATHMPHDVFTMYVFHLNIVLK
jgi:hypothetical protein